ncbi:MAG: hypothetical protein AAFP20_16555 [Cyanobacteria bacterium J06614_10]
MATKSTEARTTSKRASTKKSTAKQAQTEPVATPAKSKTTAKKTKARTTTTSKRSPKATKAEASQAETTQLEAITPEAITPEAIQTQETQTEATEAQTTELKENDSIVNSDSADPQTEAANTTQMPLIPSIGEPSAALAAPTKASQNGTDFLAANCISDDIWVPSAAIPEIDEATYRAQRAQAEAQRRAIEVASLNLKNINDLHQLERQSIDVAISTKENETRQAQLTSANIDYQTQLERNGEKGQYLRQATARREAATRESDYTDQLIALKDQNFELDIQQAQSAFSEKAARYRAQLNGQ